MSLGMVVTDNNMAQRESSKLGSLSNDSNNTASTVRLLKFKRRKVSATREFPPISGSIVTRLRSRLTSGAGVGSLSKDEEKSGLGDDHISNYKDVAVEMLETSPEQYMVLPVEVEPLNVRFSDCSDGNLNRASSTSNDAAVSCVGVNRISRRRQNIVRDEQSLGSDSIRTKVKETLRLFYGTCRKLLQAEEAKPTKTKNFRVDFEACKILKKQGKYLNSDAKIVGSVPGVEVGDEFQFRMELNILGMHRPSQGGIDYMNVGEEILATSIVTNGWYDDELDSSDVLTYTGQGGNVVKVTKEVKEPQDQKLVTGNLALANSFTKKNPVRVIKGHKKAVLKSSGDDNNGRSYVYDGLYVVEKYWQETGSHGKLVYKFKLKRIPGQPELSWKIVTKSKKSKCRQGLCKSDISEGKERLPICAVNEIDDEKPPSFIYTAKMIYPDWFRPVLPEACGCTTRCAEARNCACVAKNGGEIPYNYNGAVVERKNLIYECGPLCKCPASCYLRVSQRGIKYQLEIFKTESRGWGVRSLSSIPSGSFICEYAGELLEDKEAEERIEKDEYLFDIGNNYDSSLAGGVEMEEGEDDERERFTIDAALKGNVGRFINHSCWPNLYAQDVLYDHQDTRIPHVMFFALDNIPPLQELCYDYNYKVDEVRDANGNVKRKNCYCGSSQCTGRLY